MVDWVVMKVKEWIRWRRRFSTKAPWQCWWSCFNWQGGWGRWWGKKRRGWWQRTPRWIFFSFLKVSFFQISVRLEMWRWFWRCPWRMGYRSLCSLTAPNSPTRSYSAVPQIHHYNIPPHKYTILTSRLDPKLKTSEQKTFSLLYSLLRETDVVLGNRRQKNTAAFTINTYSRRLPSKMMQHAVKPSP